MDSANNNIANTHTPTNPYRIIMIVESVISMIFSKSAKSLSITAVEEYIQVHRISLSESFLDFPAKSR